MSDAQTPDKGEHVDVHGRDEDIVDLEECAKEGRTPPKGKRYRVRVDKKHYVFDKGVVTGREILEKAGKTPASRYRLDQKLKGGETKKVGLDEEVDLTTPGIERFITLPLDQTEGETAEGLEPLRREFDLPDDDAEHLDARGLPWETLREGNALWLLVHEFPVPAGYSHRLVTVALQIPGDYPTAEINMAYFAPDLALESGRSIRQIQARATVRGVSYQRWSRHRTPQNPWRPGLDSVATHLALVEEWLRREVPGG